MSRAYSNIYNDFLKYWSFIGGDDRPPAPKQRETAAELLHMPRIATIRWTRGSGKTFLLGKLGFFLAYRLGWDIIVGAPTEKQTEAIMGEVDGAARRILGRNDLISNTERVKIKPTGAEIRALGLGSSSYKTAQSKHAQLVIIDEMQQLVAGEVAESVIGMVAPHQGSVWLAGLGGSPGSASAVFGAMDGVHSVHPWQEHIKLDPVYVDYVDDARQTMPPPEFAAHYECADLDMSEFLLVPSLDTIDQHMHDPFTMVCIDWGKRRDQSVATVIDRDASGIYYHLRDWKVLNGSYTEQGRVLGKWLLDIPYDEIRVEINGVGDGASDILKEEILKSDPDSRIRDVWVLQNKNKALHRLFGAARDKKVLYDDKNPRSVPFIKEITSIKYRMSESGSMIIPQSSHSDYLSSILLAFVPEAKVYL